MFAVAVPPCTSRSVATTQSAATAARAPAFWVNVDTMASCRNNYSVRRILWLCGALTYPDMATGIFVAARATLSQDLGSADGGKDESLEKNEGGHGTGGSKLQFEPYICLEAHLRPERIVAAFQLSFPAFQLCLTSSVHTSSRT
jgi:hypothetical protein